VVTSKFLAKFQSLTAVNSISPSIANKVVTTKYLAKFQSPRAITRPKIIGPERNANLICNLSLYTYIPKIKSISRSIANKVVATKYLAKFQSPRAITRPKIIGPKRNVNLICNLSLYTYIPNIKLISQSIAKKRWWQLFYFGITDMGDTICPGHLVAGT
jgi:hypothetical protein